MNRREFINSTVACGAVAIVPLCDAAEKKEGAKMPVKVKKGKVAVVYFSLAVWCFKFTYYNK